MKTARNQNTRQNKQMTGHLPKPEIRDDLDSRKNEEWLTKGDDVTHTRKARKDEKLKGKK